MKILYLSYYYPPNNEIASLRSMYQVKYLRQLGADVSVVCFDSNTSENIYLDRTENDHYVLTTPTLSSLKEKFISKSTKSETKNKDACEKIKDNNISKNIKSFLRKTISTALVETIAEIYRLLHHTIFLVKAFLKSLKLCESFRYDYVYASYGPESTIITGFFISKLFNIKLVTEFRDRWYNNPYRIREKSLYYRSIVRYLEKEIVNSSAIVIGVSPSMVEELNSDYPKQRVELIYNGYDKPLKISEDQISFTMPTADLTVAYTGSLYAEFRDPRPLFEALQKIDWDIKFVYCGKSYDFIHELAENYNVASKVINLGFQSNEVSRLVQTGCDTLLLVGWNDPRDRGVLTGKIFEYLDAKKPVLFIGYPHGDVDSLLKQTNSGETCLSAEEVVNFLNQLKGASTQKYNFVNTREYSRINQSENLYKILKQTHEGEPTG